MSSKSRYLSLSCQCATDIFPKTYYLLFECHYTEKDLRAIGTIFFKSFLRALWAQHGKESDRSLRLDLEFLEEKYRNEVSMNRYSEVQSSKGTGGAVEVMFF